MSISNQKKETDYHHGNLKEALVETALEMITEENLENITVRELTKRLGTSRSAIYRHFASKDDVIKAAVRAGFGKLLEHFLPVFQEQGLSTLERLHRLGLSYLQFALEHTALFRALFGDYVMDQREETCEREGTFDLENPQETDAFHALVFLVSQAQEEGLLKKDDPMLQSAAIWAMVHGLAVLIIDGHLLIEENMEQIYEISYQMLLEGLKA